MKFGHLIQYNKGKLSFKSHAENHAGRLVPELLLFFEKALYEVKANGQHLSFNIFRLPSSWHTIKTNCIKL